MKFKSDIDIDFADREQLLSLIDHTCASIKINENFYKKHNTGIYPTYIPYDPINNFASIDYKEAEDRGYIKLDFLNVWVYKLVKDENDLNNLMREPNWDNLQNIDFFSKLIHIGNHYNSMINLPSPIDSVEKMAMFLALIRPGKKHLLNKSWEEIEKYIWEQDNSTGYQFKKSHAISYSMLVVVHMNLIDEGRGELKLFEEIKATV